MPCRPFKSCCKSGAGTGLIFILRWFWWRINAWTEIAGMVISFGVAIYFEFIHEALGFTPWPSHWTLVAGVTITTIGWLLVTYLTRPTDMETLCQFYSHVSPRRSRLATGHNQSSTTRLPYRTDSDTRHPSSGNPLHGYGITRRVRRDLCGGLFSLWTKVGRWTCDDGQCDQPSQSCSGRHDACPDILYGLTKHQYNINISSFISGRFPVSSVYLFSRLNTLFLLRTILCVTPDIP